MPASKSKTKPKGEPNGRRIRVLVSLNRDVLNFIDGIAGDKGRHRGMVIDDIVFDLIKIQNGK